MTTKEWLKSGKAIAVLEEKLGKRVYCSILFLFGLFILIASISTSIIITETLKMMAFYN